VAAGCSNVVSKPEAEENPKLAEIGRKLDLAREVLTARAGAGAVRAVLAEILALLEGA
jgi:hypothetical protein